MSAQMQSEHPSEACRKTNPRETVSFLYHTGQNKSRGVMLEFPSVCSPTGGCQRGDGAYQTKPSIRFPSCKAQCNIVSCILQENTRWLRGKGDPLTGVTNKPVLPARGWAGEWGVGASAGTGTCYSSTLPQGEQARREERAVSRMSQDCDVPQY